MLPWQIPVTVVTGWCVRGHEGRHAFGNIVAMLPESLRWQALAEESWPTTTGEGTLDESDSGALGVGIGDVFRVDALGSVVLTRIVVDVGEASGVTWELSHPDSHTRRFLCTTPQPHGASATPAYATSACPSCSGVPSILEVAPSAVTPAVTTAVTSMMPVRTHRVPVRRLRTPYSAGLVERRRYRNFTLYVQTREGGTPSPEQARQCR